MVEGEGEKRAGRNLGSAIRHGAGPFHTTHTNTASYLALDLSTRAAHAMGGGRMDLGPEVSSDTKQTGHWKQGAGDTRSYSRERRT